MHKHYNGLKTVALIASLIALLTLVGWLIANATGNSIFLWLFALLGVGSTAYSYWNSDKLALRSMGAYPVTEAQAPQLYRIVRQLSQSANQPMPRLYISPQLQPNAFATGRDPEHAAVCCTEGILQILDERELRGVLGHELMHVYNRDILTSSMAGGIAGIISSLGTMFMWGSMGRSREDRGNGLAVILLAFLAPLAASVIQLAVSRTREFDADEDGAKLTNDPLALASALKKLDAGTTRAPMRDPRVKTVSHLMIANPLGGLRSLFSTHPPMAERIARLERMAGY
ncbi:zinc metalloprotease HtpX [Boudabousia marimammalium]|uniref:Protease HtpX homolog n=1 Tax=Boudabousia marimammalium TaxID=156892 RepID=A0A1Q5PMJ0_9ACTO|nr:zinc metalloprotease HtpX [Boudabousia marimammalium]OKL48746.1 zinc metalloprotease HtpX [Boudabousia marimammalium]